jgi:hypothetical protein
MKSVAKIATKQLIPQVSKYETQTYLAVFAAFSQGTIMEPESLPPGPNSSSPIPWSPTPPKRRQDELTAEQRLHNNGNNTTAHAEKDPGQVDPVNTTPTRSVSSITPRMLFSMGPEHDSALEAAMKGESIVVHGVAGVCAVLNLFLTPKSRQGLVRLVCWTSLSAP